MRNREARFHNAIGRLKDGVSIQAAQADLAAVQGRLALQFPATDRDWTALVEPLKEQSVAGVRRSLWVLFGAVSLVLLIACANVACLLLAQANRREREIAVRFSLGARRSQVIGELLLESFCLAMPGAVLGLGLSVLAAGAFRRAAALLPRASEIHLDWRIVVFTLALSILTTALFGLIPAWRATRREVSGILAHGSRTQIGGRHTIERLLVSAQIALAIVLLVGSGLLIRSLSRLGQVSLGFDPEHVLAFHVSASFSEKNDSRQIFQRLVRTLDATRTIPGVQATALSHQHSRRGRRLPGRNSTSPAATPNRKDEKMFADSETVSPDFFRVLGIPLLSGHTCQVSFDPKAPQYVLVSNSFAQRFFPGRNPIGEHLTIESGAAPFEIIGVAGDIRKHGYAKDPQPVIYACEIPRFYPGPTFLARTTGDPMRLAEAVRLKIRSIDPNRAVYGITRLSDYLTST